MGVDSSTRRRRYIYVSSSFIGGIYARAVSSRRVYTALGNDRARIIINRNVADSVVKRTDTVA